jgi:hypothetical protein
MPASSKASKRTQHNPRKWITAALQQGGSDGLSTSQIMKEASSLAGAKIPDFSIYSALRTLKRSKVVASKRHGHQLVFKLVRPPEPASKPFVPPSVAARVRARAPAESVPPAVESPAPSPPTAALIAPVTTPDSQPLHKLAVGEAVILRVGEEHVETATNVHGKIVLEKHRRPS